jgi:hypothetical protein
MKFPPDTPSPNTVPYGFTFPGAKAPLEGERPPGPRDERGRILSPTVLHLRRWQVRSVVIGVFSGLLWLLGLSFRWMWLAYLGAALVLLAWLAIPILGAWAMYRTRYPARHEAP